MNDKESIKVLINADADPNIPSKDGSMMIDLIKDEDGKSLLVPKLHSTLIALSSVKSLDNEHKEFIPKLRNTLEESRSIESGDEDFHASTEYLIKDESSPRGVLTSIAAKLVAGVDKCKKRLFL